MASSTATIPNISIEDTIGSTTIEAGQKEHSRISTFLKCSTWLTPSEPALPTSYASESDTASDSDLESVRSFFSARSLPTLGPPSKLENLPDLAFDESNKTDASREWQSPTQRQDLEPTSAPCSPGSDKTFSTLDSDTTYTEQISQPASPGAESNYSTSTSISASSRVGCRKDDLYYEVSTEGSCLQCELLGLRCSVSTRNLALKRAWDDFSSTCSRCKRGGEPFCIRKLSKRPDECAYFAAGFETHVVENKAKSLLEKKQAKMRFALPKAPAEVRLGLRRTYRRWEWEEERDLNGLGLAWSWAWN